MLTCTTRAVSAPAGPADPAVVPAGPAGALTDRESEILDLVAGGFTNAAIADRLVLSVRTVERHTLNIYTKLGVRGRAEAVAVGYTHAGGSTGPA